MMKRITIQVFIPFLFFAFFFCFSLHHASAQNTKKIYYWLNYSKMVGLTASLWVNDVPLDKTSENPVSSFENVNTWVIPGENTVKIKLAQMIRRITPNGRLLCTLLPSTGNGHS